MHEHICIYNSPMVKLQTLLQRDLVNYLLIMAQALHSNIVCTFIAFKNSVLNKYLEIIKRYSFHLV